MWVEKLPNGKFKYIERYVDPYTRKTKKVSKILAKDTAQAQTQARKILNEKIDQNLKKRMYEGVIPKIKEEFEYVDALIDLADPPLFQNYFDSMDRSYGYKKHFKSVFNLSYEYAISMGYIDDSPLARVKLIKPVVTIDDKQDISQKYLEYDEAMLLINEIRKDTRCRQTADIYELLLLTGMRIGELLALRHRDYHSQSSTLDIHGNLHYLSGIKNSFVGPTKNTSSYRTIILSDRAKEIIETNIALNEIKWGFGEEGFIFVGNRGTHRVPNNLVVTLKKANERLGAKKINKNLNNHIFRHSYISLLAELGVAPKAIMEQVGHSDLKITMQIYTHVTKKAQLDIASKLNTLK